MQRGFTLVELLVVVTIIVILLALIAPAMNKAVYQAQLINCAGKLKVVSAGVTTYAAEYKRRYPYRGLEDLMPGRSTAGWVSAMTLYQPVTGYDMRTPLKSVLSVNKSLQCPLSNSLEIEDRPGPADDDVGAEASYVMWWSWRYMVPERTNVSAQNNNPQVNQTGGNIEKGMYKIGDRFTWMGASFSVLAGDIDLRYNYDSSQVSHIDREPNNMALITAQDEVIFGTRSTVSRWLVRGSRIRGRVDLNYTFEDCSVQRFFDTPHMIQNYDQRDKRFDWTPIQFDNIRNGGNNDPRTSGGDAYQIPAN